MPAYLAITYFHYNDHQTEKITAIYYPVYAFYM